MTEKDDNVLEMFPYSIGIKRGVFYDMLRSDLTGKGSNPVLKVYEDIVRCCDLFVDGYESGGMVLAGADLYLRLKGEWNHGN